MLIDPLTGAQLTFDSSSNTYRTADSSVTYPIVDSIPQILTKFQDEGKSPIHQKYRTVFNYVDHYQKDAAIDDYSENHIPAVTKNELLRLRESILSEIDTSEFQVVLDAGCGNGWASKKLIPKGVRVISMDISSENPLKAIKMYPHENHAGLIADAFYTPLKPDSLDYIIASEIIEHVTDPAKLIINMIKLLKREGKLIITTPYNEKIEYFLCVHCNRPTPRSAHLQTFNENSLEQLIPQSGVRWSFKKLLNRSLSKTRSYMLLKFLPFRAWTVIDDLFNRILRNPSRLKIVIERVI